MFTNVFFLYLCLDRFWGLTNFLYVKYQSPSLTGLQLGRNRNQSDEK